LGFFEKLKKSQNAFDENWIMDHKEQWKNKYRNLTTKELEDKLKEIESHPQFDSSKSAKRIFWGGGIGSAMHISDREREAQRRAIRELLGLKW
jgi:CRISPR/Cas system CSM-associated protein Csm5 (group 7 of RAMP superfamily)